VFEPGERARVTSEGHVGAHFRRAIDAGNLSVVRALAHELPHVPLADALAIVLLLARREPDNYPRAAARFIGRLALERPVDLDDLGAATTAPAITSAPPGSPRSSGASRSPSPPTCGPDTSTTAGPPADKTSSGTRGPSPAEAPGHPLSAPER
jgi:hypothetical protein